jgi:hypothetical protein
MRRRWLGPAALWVVFTGYSIAVSARAGVLGFLGVPGAHPWGLQVVLDLFVSLLVALVYIAPKARRVAVPIAPYALATLTLGSVGLLAFVTHVEWAAQRERAADGELEAVDEVR